MQNRLAQMEAHRSAIGLNQAHVPIDLEDETVDDEVEPIDEPVLEPEPDVLIYSPAPTDCPLDARPGGALAPSEEPPEPLPQEEP